MATSKLQQATIEAIRKRFTDLRIKENFRPDWLTTDLGERCELDVYIPKLKIAVEVQGKQHFAYVEHFHGCYENYLAQIRRDKFKKTTCSGAHINLIEVCSHRCIKKVIDAICISSDEISELNKQRNAAAKEQVKPISKKSLYAETAPATVSIVKHMASCNVPQPIVDAVIEISNSTGKGKQNARKKRHYIISLSMFFSASVYGRKAMQLRPLEVIKTILELQKELGFEIFTHGSLTYYMRMHVTERV